MQSIAAEVIYIWVQKQHIVISTSEIAEKALIKIKLKLFFLSTNLWSNKVKGPSVNHGYWFMMSTSEMLSYILRHH